MIMMANGFRRCTGNAAKGNLTKTALSRADAANRNLTRTALSRANAAKGNLTRTAFSRADAAKGNLRLAPGTAVLFCRLLDWLVSNVPEITMRSSTGSTGLETGLETGVGTWSTKVLIDNQFAYVCGHTKNF